MINAATEAARLVRFHDARLTKPVEFDLVFAENQRARADAYLVMARPNTAGHPRLGLVVGKRILPRAVDRNRVKRCARESFRQQYAELPACDFVVRLLSKPSAGEELQALASALRRAGKRARETWPETATIPTTLASHG